MNLSNEIVVFVIKVVVLAEITNHCAGETLVSLSSHSPDFLSSSLRTHLSSIPVVYLKPPQSILEKPLPRVS